MSLLTKTQLNPRINSGKTDQIFISPILEQSQIGSVSVDLRLGCDFLVSVLSRHASITIDGERNSSVADTFFQPTRRDLGEAFTVHPAQTVLATSLEYVGLPDSVYADVVGRSSFNRLGLGIHSTFQPGFRGCISIELHNHSNIPVELIVGCKIAQARFFTVDHPEEYYGATDGRRKYIGHVRPVVSRASRDPDLKKLSVLGKGSNLTSQ